MDKIKKLLTSDYNTDNLSIELYLVNPKLIIVDTTYKRDLGFNLGSIPYTHDNIKELDHNEKIVFVDKLANDELDKTYKQYSFAKLDKGYFLEMGFIDKKLNENIRLTYLDSEHAFYVVVSIDDYQMYFRGNDDFTSINKQELFESLPKFYNSKKTDDPVIRSFRDKKSIFKKDKNFMIVTSPLIDRSDLPEGDNHFAVIQLFIDISSQEEFHNNFIQLFGFIVIFIIFFMIFVFQWAKNKLTRTTDTITYDMKLSQKISDEKLLMQPDELGMIARTYNNLHESLTHELKINKKLLVENKRFIADTVHQIRTPLSVIMMNSEMIQMANPDSDINLFIDQINASINMLTNSYEDLSYVISYDTIEYKPQSLDFTNLLHERIAFFTTIAKVNDKPLTYDIDSNVTTLFNLIEAERLIDNNISNAIKYASINRPIHITLKKQDHGFILTFNSYGEPLKNTQKLFRKNYRLHHEKRGLGLGLNMVKGICDKYHIDFTVKYQDGQNIFSYIQKT